MKQQCHGGHPAFSPLACAVENDAAAGTGEEFALFVFEHPTQGFFGEVDDAGGVCVRGVRTGEGAERQIEWLMIRRSLCNFHGNTLT